MSKSANGFGARPQIIVWVKDRTRAPAIQKMRRAGIGAVELRVDLFSNHSPGFVLKEIGRYGSFTRLATIRSAGEGGNWTASEEERLALFQKIIPRVDAVDIELSAKKILPEVVRSARRHRKKVIVSYHHFRRTPSLFFLKKFAARAKQAGADLIKIATLAKTPADVRRLADFLSNNRRQKLIVIAMGKQGRISRVVFPWMGSLLAYASLGRQPNAPGQQDYLSLKRA